MTRTADLQAEAQFAQIQAIDLRRQLDEARALNAELLEVLQEAAADALITYREDAIHVVPWLGKAHSALSMAKP